MRWFRPNTLRMRLLALTLVSATLAVAATGYMAYRQRQTDRATGRDLALRRARYFAGGLSASIADAERLLTSLIHNQDLIDGRRGACGDLFRELLAQAPSYTNFIALDAQDEVLCSALQPRRPQEVRLEFRPWFELALTSRTFVITDYIAGPLTGRPMIAVGHAITDASGHAKAVVFAGLNLSWSNGVPVSTALPAGWKLTLIDRAGTILNREPEANPRVGQPLPEVTVLKAMRGESLGVIEATNIDGGRSLYGFSSVAGGTEGVVVEGPLAVILAGANRQLESELAVIGVLLVAVLVGTLVLSERLVVRPAAMLVEATRRVAEGDLTTRAPGTLAGEFGVLAKSFNHMADGLEQREMERQRHEDALRNSETRFRELFSQMPLGATICEPADGDADFTLKEMNEAGLSLTETATEDVVGKRATEVFPGIQAMGLLDVFRRVLKTGVPESQPATLYKDARIFRWYETRVYKLASGEIVALYNDVTEIRRALDEANALLAATRLVVEEPDVQKATRTIFDACRRLLGAAGGVVFSIEPDAQHRRVLFFETGGIPCTLPLLAPVHGLRAEAYASERAIYDNRFADSPHHRLVPNGHLDLTNVLFSPVRAGGKTRGLLGLANKPGGFTDRDAQAAEAFAELLAIMWRTSHQIESIVQSEARYRNLVENMDDVVYSVDRDGRVTFISHAITQYGWAPGDIEGHRMQEIAGRFVHPDDLDGFMASAAGILDGRTDRHEFRLVGPDGKVHTVRASSRPVRDGERILGLSGLLTDLTSRRELEDQLRQAQKMEAVGRLAGGVAHDFNNLLSVILGCTEFALDATGDGDRRRQDLEEIRNAARRAAALTGQLLAFSRKQTLQPEVLDLNELIKVMQPMLGRMLGEDIELVLKPVAGLWTTKADRGQIEQVVMNLAVNARDAMPNGGRLVLETSNVESGQTLTGDHPGLPPEPHVMLTVTDTGCGMDAETKAHLFEPFFTTKPVGAGTGLGLATVYGIVNQSSGHMWVSSEIGHGTTITICLPRVAGATEGTAQASPSTGRTAGSETVLVVEDEEAVRNLIQRSLEAAGYKVLTAANGHDAITMCESALEHVDVLVTDMIMPGMSGRGLVKRLTLARPGLKVAYMSGYPGNGTTREDILEGGAVFIQKPFRGRDLANRIRELIDRDCTLPGENSHPKPA
jgi:PAS domain S-box-containing protein